MNVEISRYRLPRSRSIVFVSKVAMARDLRFPLNPWSRATPTSSLSLTYRSKITSNPSLYRPKIDGQRPVIHTEMPRKSPLAEVETPPYPSWIGWLSRSEVVLYESARMLIELPLTAAKNYSQPVA